MKYPSFSSSTLLLFSLLLSIMPRFTVSQINLQLDYENCRDAVFRCGNISAGYPFYGGNRRPGCGHPRLELHCNDLTNTTIEIVGVKYEVMDIRHDRHILRIARQDIIKTGYCRPQHPIQNSIIDSELFDMAPGYTDATLFYDCPSSFSSSFPHFPCSYYSNYKNVTLTTHGIRSHGCVANLTFLSNQTLLEIFLSKPAMDLAMEAALEGVEVKWKEDWEEACRNCNASGGACGFGFRNQTICLHPESKTKSKSKQNIVFIGSAGAAAIGLVSAICFVVLRFKGKRLSNHLSQGKMNDNARIEAFIAKFGSFAPNRYSYDEIKKITNKFKDKLGQGGFGSVYKGKLSDGRIVAVKVLSETKGNGEDFINEVASISRTSHVNIVTLLGFCFESSKRALIYEFMLHGSLDKFIYSQSRQLGWKALYDIALGIARGLEYLHQGCNTRILHFDIKPHNILLDEDFCPKIADFGLSKLCERKESVISMTGARGTAGYIAPEVYSRNLGGVSHKSDVYSYGMMVLEMVGGRRNIDVEVSQSSEIYYPAWIYKHLDQSMNLNLNEEITEEEDEIKKKLIEVSLCCIQTNPLDRPSISKVLEMLQGSLQLLVLPPRTP